MICLPPLEFPGKILSLLLEFNQNASLPWKISLFSSKILLNQNASLPWNFQAKYYCWPLDFNLKYPLPRISQDFNKGCMDLHGYKMQISNTWYIFHVQNHSGHGHHTLIYCSLFEVCFIHGWQIFFYLFFLLSSLINKENWLEVRFFL